MPSFRVTAQVLGVRGHHHPDDVMVAARDSIARQTHLDDSYLDLIHGVPSIALRFTVDPASRAEEAEQALAIASQLLTDLGPVAELGTSLLHRRTRGEWVPAGLVRARMDP